MKIGICGNITIDTLAAKIDELSPDYEIIVGKTDAFRLELAEPFGDFRNLDICVIALDWRDITGKLYDFTCGDDPSAVESEFRNACEDISRCIGKYREHCTAKFLIFSPVDGWCNPAGFISRLVQPSPIHVFHDCQKIFDGLCRSMPDVYPVDIEELSARAGKDAAFSPSSRLTVRQPFSSLMIDSIARHLSAMCVQFTRYPLKCVVLDLDNTLWGGVIGEAGYEHILLDDSGPGKAYREFQAEILKLYRQGVILAVCSKNNTCDVLEVMEKHPDMLIRPNLISCFRINWDDKPKNMLQISTELKIGLDSIMFVDDMAAERAMMQAVLPQVEILPLPDDPLLFADTLKQCSRFWPIQITKDDFGKGTFFSQESVRKRTRELSANLDEFLAGSGIKVRIAEATAETLPRITQLFNKTNQFNLTTKRYSQSELEELSGGKTNHLVFMEMNDRFGEYGIIAAALILGDTIDSFLLSCRAFGKQVETAFLVHILRFLKIRGTNSAFGLYKGSGKNGIAGAFYENTGFTLESSGEARGSLWRFDLRSPIPQSPPWVALTGGLFGAEGPAGEPVEG